jgi:hypothetical protein
MLVQGPAGKQQQQDLVHYSWRTNMQRNFEKRCCSSMTAAWSCSVAGACDMRCTLIQLHVCLSMLQEKRPSCHAIPGALTWHLVAIYQVTLSMHCRRLHSS